VVTPSAPPPDRSRVEVVEVPRAWVREQGWPSSWQALLAAGFEPTVEDRWVLTGRATQALDVAYLRKGDAGQACLFVQAWTGPA